MKHPDDLIARSLDGDVSRTDAAQVSAHLVTCAACRALADDLERTDRLLRRREEVSGVPPFANVARPSGMGWLWAPIAVAVVVVAATIVAMPRDNGVAAPSKNPVVAPSPSVAPAPPTETPTPTASPASSARWTGFYLRAARPDPKSDLGMRPRVLVETDGSFPGRVVDDTVGWQRVGDWSPSGSAVLLFSDRGVYVVSPGGSPRLLASDPAREWSWVDDEKVYSIQSRGEGAQRVTELVEVAIADRKVVRTRPVAVGIAGGLLSPGGRYLAEQTGGGDSPQSVQVYDFSTGENRQIPGASSLGGWLDADRLIVRSGTTVEVVSLPSVQRVSVFTGARGAYAAAHVGRIVALDAAGFVWIVDANGDKKRVPGSAFDQTRSAAGSSGWPASVSTDGRTISFDETTSRYPAFPLYRTGVRDLDTGEVTYACEDDCTMLRIR